MHENYSDNSMQAVPRARQRVKLTGRFKKLRSGVMKAMILAAGRGERMRPLTDETPKPLLQVGGRALIDYHLHAIAEAGISEVVVNLAWLKDALRDHIGDGERFGLNVQYSDEGAAALETGGGIFRALALLGSDPFWIVNGDVHAEFDFSPRPLDASVLAHLVLVPNPPHNKKGDFTLADGAVRNGRPAQFTYSGIALLRPELFAGCEDGVFPLAPLLRSAADDGRVTGELLTGRWCDVGTPERLAALENLVTASH